MVKPKLRAAGMAYDACHGYLLRDFYHSHPSVPVQHRDGFLQTCLRLLHSGNKKSVVMVVDSENRMINEQMNGKRGVSRFHMRADLLTLLSTSVLARAAKGSRRSVVNESFIFTNRIYKRETVLPVP